MEPEIIQLIDEHGYPVDFELVASFDVDDNRYAVVVPVDGDGEEAYILRVEQDEDGNDIFVAIEDEDEFNDAVEAYNELMEEYEDYYDEEDFDDDDDE